jgi:hypothetical protein
MGGKMKEVIGNLWFYYDKGATAVITTNGYVKRDGRCVMGRGTAHQARDRFPTLPLNLGCRIREDGNHVYYFPQLRLITLPVKHVWWDDADPTLIAQSLDEMVNLVDTVGLKDIVMTHPGCGNGRLRWSDIRPLLVGKLDDRFTIVDLGR